MNIVILYPWQLGFHQTLIKGPRIYRKHIFHYLVSCHPVVNKSLIKMMTLIETCKGVYNKI